MIDYEDKLTIYQKRFTRVFHEVIISNHCSKYPFKGEMMDYEDKLKYPHCEVKVHNKSFCVYVCGIICNKIIEKIVL